jgi:hypothetical protein
MISTFTKIKIDAIVTVDCANPGIQGDGCRVPSIGPRNDREPAPILLEDIFGISK